jgi:cellulose synthase/poly-beta-1,6-N-acetylglucosamine synthase-like glycosyltransferase/spore germination protein YaaH/peptidoglycan/xylan/chitin deacetylase (PgdA/CDA1 family)
MAKAIFYDPQRKRWRRIRRLMDVLGLTASMLVVFFLFSALTQETLGTLLLPERHRPYKALKEKERKRPRPRVSAGKPKKPPTQVVLNSGDGVRAAFYVTWDAAAYSSLREYVRQIDILYPEWLHVVSDDGRMQAVSPELTLYDVVKNGVVHTPDSKERPVMKFLKDENAETEVLPLVNNFNPTTNQWIANIEPFLNRPDARASFRRDVAQFLASDNYKGLTLDFEGFPRSAQPGFRQLVDELHSDFQARGMKLHVAVPVNDDDFDYAYLAAHSDGVILMNYDEHFQGGDPGPIASQEWFTKNLVNTLKVIPKEKLICAIGSYGYDWSVVEQKKGKPKVDSARSIDNQEAWLSASDSEAKVNFDLDSMNPHFAYEDEKGKRHDVWYLDGVTALNQMRAAVKLGINTFALWRLGSEDRSLWPVFDLPGTVGVVQELRLVPPGQDVDMEGAGEVVRIGSQPAAGQRTFTLDASTGLITDETMTVLPRPYQVDQYGADPKQIALTFDDGPDPDWTPKILQVLKEKNAKAAFFMIGLQAEKFPRIAQQVYADGHEIGNHTFTHPDISNIRKSYMRVELNLAERLFASRLGVKPLLFRPPYSIDQEPDTADQVRPLEIAQEMGYITVGDKIDPHDWQDPPAVDIAKAVMAHLPPCDPDDQRCGNIVLLHDGGGNRTQTVKALPLIIDGLRQRGYEVVPVSQLLGKPYNQVMVPIAKNERWSARIDSFGFWLFGVIGAAIVVIFFLGDVLMSARLFLVGAAAVFDRFHHRIRQRDGVQLEAAQAYKPAVAVVIPAFNEEKVIVRTVRAALHSNYPKLRVIVVDDGSSDRTLDVTQNAFADEIRDGRVTLLTKPNSGKAEALNYGLEFVHEEIFVGIDADTVIARDAISRLVPHFLDARVGAIAGNAKVGNRVNWWTRWQALEYVTSQNFERRALNVLGAVSVVPGAIGAWRTAAVREVGAFHVDTVAEDADLTMALLRRGYRVEYEDRALAYTEAPMNARGLMRQRFRWSFGIMQSVYKHRAAFGRKGVLGWVALPNIVIFQILLPLVSPFIDLMFAYGTFMYLLDRYFHPETADFRSFEKLVLYFAMFLIIDFVASALAFFLERRTADNREDMKLLLHVWLQRFAYRQLFSIVLIKTLKRAMTGRAFNWDKLERTAAMPYAKVGSLD